MSLSSFMRPIIIACYTSSLLFRQPHKISTPSEHITDEEEMVVLDADPFLNDLVKKFERRKEKGSVTITLKRSCLLNPKSKKAREVAQAQNFKCLVRATDGKKSISTAVSGKDQTRFQASFSTILKAHMDSLKRRARTEKAKAVKK